MTGIEIVGFGSAILIGVSLGLIGGGGSILTVPILVYLFGIEPMLATAYSLFVVGSSSLLGAASYLKKGLLNIKTGTLFAIPSIAAVFVTRKYFMQMLPDHVTAALSESVVSNVLFGGALILGVVIAAIILKRFLDNGEPATFFKVFGLMVPAAAMVFVMRQFVLPVIPHELMVGGIFTITKSSAIMMLFGAVMLIASVGMIRGKKEDTPQVTKRSHLQMGVIILLEGLLVGTVTGVVGAGGGFLIIPALVLLAGLPMKVAVGTSLAIISVKSLMGFMGDVANQSIDWTFLLIFTAMSLSGIFVGTWLSNYVEGEKLKKGFGWFVLVMALFIFLKEIV